MTLNCLKAVNRLSKRTFDTPNSCLNFSIRLTIQKPISKVKKLLMTMMRVVSVDMSRSK